MELFAIGSFCLTLIFGLLALFALFRIQQVKGQLLQRIQQLEAQAALTKKQSPVESASKPVTQPAPYSPPERTPPFQDPAGLPTAAAPATPAGKQPQVVPLTPRAPRRLLPAPLQWFVERHLMVQVGVIILFIGIAFLLKYAADQGWLSLELRHGGAAIGGVILAAIGWALRRKARTYGLALQGAGLGVVYLTTFFAFRFYALIPAGLAFALFVALGVLCAALAVINDARILAFLAVIGAFLAPILASSEGGNHVVLFSYYTVVNAAIFAIAWFKAWRSLNLAGFGFTLLAAAAWGEAVYQPALFATTEPFLLLFFFAYLGIALLYAVRQSKTLAGNALPDLVDVTLVFGNPLATFVLQAALVAHIEYGAAWSALALGGLYTLISIVLLRRAISVVRPLVECFLFLSFFFLALCAPLFFDAQITAALWAVGGAAWVWLGVRRRRIWNVMWGLLVQFGAGQAHLWARVVQLESDPSYFDFVFLGGLLLGVAGVFSAYQIQRLARSGQSKTYHWLATGTGLWGLAWWYGGGADQILTTVDAPYRFSGLVAFYALSGAAGLAAGRRLRWILIQQPLRFLLPVFMALAVLQLRDTPHHFAAGGWYAWPLALAAHCWMLLGSAEALRPPAWRKYSQAGALWLVTFLATWFTGWSAARWLGGDTWMTVAVILAATVLLLLFTKGARWLTVHFAGDIRTYQIWGAGPVVVFVLIWMLLLRAGDNGDSSPLPFIPLFNPLDLAYLAGFGALFYWVKLLDLAQPRSFYLAWGAVSFLGLNLALARIVHQLTGVDYRWGALYRSPVLQTTYAIVWGVLALTLMFWATRRRVRSIWLAGSAILALTVLKLLIVDLANAETIARIISFIGVGLLVIVIAYFAPVPPITQSLDTTSSNEA
jgi:uncharacterized membrane protein